MVFPVRSLVSILLCLSCLSWGPVLHAQYAEPDVEVLLEHHGTSLAVGLNDLDDDGLPDLAISTVGSVSALSGADASTLWTRADAGLLLGAALERMDWNGDGVLDVVASDPGFSFGPDGQVFVFSGLDGATLTTLAPGVTFPNFATRTATGGDFDGDGNEDLLTGSSDTNFPDAAAGRIDLFRRGPQTTPFATVTGDFEGDFLGSLVAFLGDTSTPPDGHDELAIGLGDFGTGSCCVRVLDSLLGERFTVSLPMPARDIDGGEDLNGDTVPDLVAATLEGVVVLSGADGAVVRTLELDDEFESVALIPDLDGDGVREIAAGAPKHSSGASLGGRVLVFSGATGAVLRTITSTVADLRLGFEVRPMEDLDGDGRDDLLVGALGRGPDGPDAAVLVLSLGAPCTVVDLETAGDGFTPLVNGQHLDGELAALATVTSTGANAGLAVFDSTPGGPNDPSQDPDLLVGTGNLLILQTENFPPDGDDLFPRPNDDDDGGTVSFAFPAPVEAAGVRLVDVDDGDGDWSVVLTDAAGARRTYSVPAGWTGDHAAGEPGHAVLDLTSLAPQPGFASVATASEDAGFDAALVIAIDVHVGGSGALDDLEVCPSGAEIPRAGVSVRNGSGLNPSILAGAAAPVIGGTFSADLDCSAQGPGLAILEVRRLPDDGRVTLQGEVLVDGELVHRVVRTHAGGVQRLEWSIPHDLALAGVHLHAQGLCRPASTGPGKRLARVSGRLSNAVDLVLGF